MKRTVYFYGKGKFGFKPVHGASIAGHFELREYDEQVDWHWCPSPGLDTKPTQEWLYWHTPNK